MTPPMISSNVRLSHRFRFVSTSGTATAITPTSLLGAAGTVGVIINSFVACINESVKLRSVEIWSPPAAQGGNATCSVDWVGFNNSPNVEVSDTTVSVAQPAHVRTAPPAQSLAAFWQVAGSGTLCTITAPTGSIIDVNLDLILSDDESALTTIAVTTDAVSVMYYLSLDPNATHRFTPVSLTTTT